MIAGLVGAYDFDHRTTPEVVRISKESNILRASGTIAVQKSQQRLATLNIRKEVQVRAGVR